MTTLILNKENVEYTKIHKLYTNHPRKHFHWWGLIIDSEKKYSYNMGGVAGVSLRACVTWVLLYNNPSML